ncbi:MAG: hypothetical protein ABSC33_13340 [Candidatus Sulfotelmatobacter sp.]|jgi:hypothetical protein
MIQRVACAQLKTTSPIFTGFAPGLVRRMASELERVVATTDPHSPDRFRKELYQHKARVRQVVSSPSRKETMRRRNFIREPQFHAAVTYAFGVGLWCNGSTVPCQGNE